MPSTNTSTEKGLTVDQGSGRRPGNGYQPDSEQAKTKLTECGALRGDSNQCRSLFYSV